MHPSPTNPHRLEQAETEQVGQTEAGETEQAGQPEAAETEPASLGTRTSQR
jgi:hypothetical protein